MAKKLAFSKSYRITWAIKEITSFGFLTREKYEDILFVNKRTSTRDLKELKTILKIIYGVDLVYKRSLSRYELKQQHRD